MTSTFTADVYQNAYLPEGSLEVHAIMTVTAPSEAIALSNKAETPLLFGMICDVSGSMNGGKIVAARQALVQAIELLPNNASFFIVLGSSKSHLLVPTTRASTENKARAIEQAKKINAQGGTVISTWLQAALEEFNKQPQAIAQALLLTDGQNDTSDHDQLAKALDRCEEKFQCDCRGVGTNWNVKELQKIGTRLLGSTDIIPEAEDMAADFQNILGQALNKSIREVRLRLWSPRGATVMYCKQVSPEILDLTDRATPVNPQTQDFPTGAWGSDESRDFHFCIRVKPGQVGDEMLAGRASLLDVVNGVENNIAEAKILAIWTDDEVRSAKINPQVAHYTGQAELSEVIQSGLAARDRNQFDVATAKLGRAVQLAHASGNESTAKLLRKIVDVEDAETGTVKLKRSVEKADAMALETRSVKTTRIQKHR